ncbi:hypothetical protein HMPREF0653_01263 [Prevotella disiens JCM 6334 = ATCC 29426]|uniref:Uncharacterized protein n=1 Tax=Prevotella disiens JCM 6334 = ATCC 29426 TaxID=1235811 RepID=A0ABP2Y7L0_9BACT|nr:hypothetical protein HMPREF0653_01263 [Prevotella disiens JCM 6334 = ATCC 29426]
MLFRYGKVSYFIKNNQIFRITLIALKCKTAYFELQNRRFYAPKQAVLCSKRAYIIFQRFRFLSLPYHSQ